MINSRDSSCDLSEETQREIARAKQGQVYLLSQLWNKHGKTTHYDRIMQNMNVEKMAELLINPIQMMNGEEVWHTSAGGFTEQSEAIQAEIEWLNGVTE